MPGARSPQTLTSALHGLDRMRRTLLLPAAGGYRRAVLRPDRLLWVVISDPRKPSSPVRRFLPDTETTAPDRDSIRDSSGGTLWTTGVPPYTGFDPRSQFVARTGRRYIPHTPCLFRQPGPPAIDKRRARGVVGPGVSCRRLSRHRTQAIPQWAGAPIIDSKPRKSTGWLWRMTTK